MNKNRYKNSILRFFANKSIVSLETLKKNRKSSNNNTKSIYAFNRSIKNLVQTKDIELINSGHQYFARLTQGGKIKLNNVLLSGEETLLNTNRDGFWRIIILDLPEEKKKERNTLHYLLKKASFVCITNNVWISPDPYEHLFVNIKKDLGLKTEMIIIVTDKIDKETNQSFINAIRQTN